MKTWVVILIVLAVIAIIAIVVVGSKARKESQNLALLQQNQAQTNAASLLSTVGNWFQGLGGGDAEEDWAGLSDAEQEAAEDEAIDELGEDAWS